MPRWSLGLGAQFELAAKWARIEVRPKSLQAVSLAIHAVGAGCKMAMEIFVRSEIPVREMLQDRFTATGQELLKGYDPQPA